jgi:fucose 4-O-acetylase-like acetyltransferase
MALRNIQIDITKGIAIILMIIGHCSLFDGTMRYVIFSFHMPLFFIFSGYFFRNKPIVDVFKTGLDRLVKPYLIYAFLTELLFRLFWKKGFITCITDILFAHGGPKNTVLLPTETSLGPIWFLMALFWCRFFYAIIFKICKHHIYLSEIIAFIVSLLAICVGKYYLNMPLGILTGASGLAFYGAGVILRDTKYRTMYAFVVVWLFAVYYHITYVDMVNFNYQFYPFDFICGIGGSLLIFFVSWFILNKTKIHLFATLGVYSLEILCVHQIVMSMCNIWGYNGWVFFFANISIPIILPLMYYKYKIR